MMYIEKYWCNGIGGTDDSLTLINYLESKQKETIPLGEIFSDFGVDELHGEFRQADSLTVFVHEADEDEEFDMEIELYYVIDLVTDLAALLLECKVNGCVYLQNLDWEPDNDASEKSGPKVCITATLEEHALMNQALKDFVSAPDAYNISEMMSEEELTELAAACEGVRKELYE